MLNKILNKSLLSVRQLGFVFSSLTGAKLPKILLRRLFRYIQTDIIVTDFDNSLIMSLNLSEHMQRRIFWMGYYSEDIVSVLDYLITPSMMILDVGANVGEITLVAAKRVGTNGRVYSFEPINKIASKLEKHVELNKLTQVEIQRYALGNETKTQIPIYSSCGQQVSDKHEGLGSLYSQNEEDHPVQYVQLITMDDWVNEHLEINTIDLIKIDIEGAELACLQGAKETLQRFKPKIIIEIQDFSAEQAGYKATDITDLLSDVGYEFYRIEKAGRLTAITRSDLLDFQNVLCIHCEDTKRVQ